MKIMSNYTLFSCLVLVSLLTAISHCADFKLGLENLSPVLIEELQSRSNALLTNQTGKDQQGKSSAQVLTQLGIPLKKILVPEHGLQGTVAAARTVTDGVDQESNIPVLSLYGDGTGKKISQTMLEDIEVILVDIQDSGMRHYTYISTLYHILQAAASFNKRVIVLDRPNPLGSVMEGPLVEASLQSFISIAPIPLRHGMTIGELARYFNQRQEVQAQLLVVPMKNYERTMGLPKHLSAHLSPNIRNHNACYGYSFLGLMGVIRPFDIGIGTQHAFQGVFLPENLDKKPALWKELSSALKKLRVPTHQHSYYHPKKKKMYRGLAFTIDSIDTISSWAVFWAIVMQFKKHGFKLTCSPSFDKAIGSASMREIIHQNKSLAQIEPLVNQGLMRFQQEAQDSYLYSPLPKLF